MKIIFLDIDGVMNSFHEQVKPEDKIYTGPFWYTEDISPKFINKLNKIIEKTEAQVVISSSWRKKHTLKVLRKMFDIQGFKGEIIDFTPHLKRDKEGNILDRGDEIKNWIDNSEDIDNFVIIDDFDYLNFDKWFPHQFVYVKDGSGLQENHVQQAVNILNKE